MLSFEFPDHIHGNILVAFTSHLSQETGNGPVSQ